MKRSEQQVVQRRVDRGDSEAIGRSALFAAEPRPWHRIGGSRLRANANDVVDGQEVTREVEPLDQRELVAQFA